MSTDALGSYLLLSPDKSANISNEIAAAATRIALHNFQWRYVTFVFVNSTLLYGVELFLQMYKKSVIVGKGTNYPHFVGITRQFVLFCTDVTNLKHALDWLEAHQFDNTGKYIVICESSKPQECDEYDAVKIFWDHKIVNVVFLKGTADVTGYTYFPLDNESCACGMPVRLTALDSCVHNNDKPTRRCNIFYEKLKNLHKCKVVASTFAQIPFMRINNGTPGGADGDLLGVIGEGLNASLEMMTPHIGYGWGKIDANGTWSGSLADVYYNVANFSMTSAALTLTRVLYFQTSIEYNTASFVWVTHPAILKPSSLKLLYPFQPTAHIALALSFIFVILYAFIAKSEIWSSCRRKFKVARSQSSVVFNSWKICMGLPTTQLPTKPALQYIAMIWIWYCVLIRTFYQVYLISALQGNFYHDEFETINDVIKAKYPYGGGTALKDYYIDNPRVQDNWVIVNTPDIIPIMTNVSNGMKFVLGMNMETAKTLVKRNKIGLHILPEKICVSPTVIFFKKFSPLANSVNRVLRRLIESGFTSKLYKDHASTTDINKVVDNKKPIELEHFTGCYAILVLGWIVSAGFFLIEIYLGKVCKN